MLSCKKTASLPFPTWQTLIRKAGFFPMLKRKLFLQKGKAREEVRLTGCLRSRRRTPDLQGPMWSCKKTWVLGLEVSYVRKQLMVLRKILVARKLASTSSTLWSPQLSLWRATRCLNGIRWCWMVLVEVVLVEMELLGWSCKVVVRK